MMEEFFHLKADTKRGREEAEDKPQSQSHVLRDLVPLPSPHPIRTLLSNAAY